MCPSAVVAAFGVSIGSNNPAYNVETDLVNFNGDIYDFEPYVVAGNKDQCKDGGWMNVRRADGSSFRNQGDCVSYTNNGRVPNANSNSSQGENRGGIDRTMDESND